MGKIYTSRYSNKDLQYTDALKVGISLGQPRFPLKYELSGNIVQLAPNRTIFRMTDKVAFRRRYMDQLNALGKREVEKLINEAWKEPEKDLILLCYEDVTCDDPTKNWCHRTTFAEWYEEKFGIKVEEYPDSGNFAAKHKQEPEEEYEQISLLF